jgi:hypothetical protein
LSKTFPGISSHRLANPGQPVMMVLAIKTNSRLVWNFQLRGRPQNPPTPRVGLQLLPGQVSEFDIRGHLKPDT